MQELAHHDALCAGAHRCFRGFAAFFFTGWGGKMFAGQSLTNAGSRSTAPAPTRPNQYRKPPAVLRENPRAQISTGDIRLRTYGVDLESTRSRAGRSTLRPRTPGSNMSYINTGQTVRSYRTSPSTLGCNLYLNQKVIPDIP
eukprot:3141191-Rhodomonas_salina.2